MVQWFKITQPVVVISHRRFRTTYQSHLQQSRILLAYYAASSGNFLPTFRENLSVPSSSQESLWLFTQWVVVISHRRFGTTYQSHLQVKNLSDLLRSQEWSFLTDVSGQPTSPIFNSQESFWPITQPVVVISYRRFGTAYRSHPQNSRGPETSVRITTTRRIITQKSAVLSYFAAEAWNHAIRSQAIDSFEKKRCESRAGMGGGRGAETSWE